MLTSFLLALPREGFTMRRGLYAVLAALVVTLSACGINSIPTAEENAKAKWADVQNQYQRRADLVPNLVATVRAAATQERTVLREVTEARASASRITVTPDQLTDPAAMQRYAAAQTQLTLTLQRLQEAYPELHTNENFLTLQSQLEGTENRIAVARRPDVFGALLVTIAFMTGVFTIYTYIAPFVQLAAGLAGTVVATMLFVFGIGATIGNLNAGALADRVGPARVLIVVLLGLTTLFATLSLAAELFPPATVRWIIVPVIALWGLVGFSFPSVQQLRLVAMDPRLSSITLSLNASAGYLGVSLGAMLGSVVVAHQATRGLGWVGAACELTAFSLLIYTLRTRASGIAPLVPAPSSAASQS